MGVRIGLLAVVLCALTASPAAAGTSLTMTGDQEDWITQGQSHLITRPAYGITVQGDASDVKISTINAASQDEWWDFEFRAPPGQTLHRGVYDRAVRAPFPEAGRPGIEISGSGRGCEPEGRFEVKDIATSGSTVTRLWLVYEQDCGAGDIAGSFGEVRINMPDPASGVAAIPSLVRWNAGDAHRVATDAPVTITAAATTHVSAASIAGRDASSFAIKGDGCNGASLPGGGSCRVAVGF